MHRHITWLWVREGIGILLIVLTFAVAFLQPGMH